MFFYYTHVICIIIKMLFYDRNEMKMNFSLNIKMIF